MKLSLYGSIGWRHPLGMGQVVDWARQFGWDYADARGISIGIPGDMERNLNAFGYDMLGPRQIRSSARHDLRRRLDDAGIPLLCIYCSSPVNLADGQGDEYRELFHEYLQLAAALGAEWVRSLNNTVHTYTGPDMSSEQAYERTVLGSREVAKLASEVGVGLLLENNENTVTPDADALDRLKRDIGDACRVGITYDPVNAYFQGDDPQQGVESLGGQIDVLHLKNVRRHSVHRWNYMPRGDASYEWTALADGDLDWRRLLGKARSTGFDGPLTFEYVNPFKGMPPQYWDGLREPEDAARVEADYLRSILDELDPDPRN